MGLDRFPHEPNGKKKKTQQKQNLMNISNFDILHQGVGEIWMLQKYNELNVLIEDRGFFFLELS